MYSCIGKVVKIEEHTLKIELKDKSIVKVKKEKDQKLNEKDFVSVSFVGPEKTVEKKETSNEDKVWMW